MHIDRRRLRAITEQVDQLHRESMRTMNRRRFLLGTGGAALAVGVAGAAIGAGGHPADASEVGLRQDPEQTDSTVAAFAQTLDLALAAAYGEMADRLTNDALRETALLFGEHHQAHADAIGTNILVQDEAALAGVQADQQLRDELERRVFVAANDLEIIAIALELEEQAAATYYEAIGRFDQAADARSLGLILPVESMHAVAWAVTLDLQPDQYLFAFQGESPAEPAEIREPAGPEEGGPAIGSPPEDTGGGSGGTGEGEGSEGSGSGGEGGA